ncbi:MAG: twin-arginine translocase TatA/TatE family subunit [Flavobacteriales bacterium]|nr:twin-arginine translocase TatA/TatE family subunit [Flavobacteriales bacterium]MDP4826994.1 twin-arginine translocase TatA/TatE family subunit [Flavobacteriales bacterium]
MGATEILFIFVVYLLLFGAKGVPSLARTLGKAVHQFRQASSDIQQEILNSSNDIRSGVRNLEKSVEDAVEPKKPELPLDQQNNNQPEA